MLGFLTAGIFADQKSLGKLRIFIPWLITAGYAATDEFHQLFVPGRSGQVSDVILDSAGAATGVLIMTGIEWLRVRKMAQKEGQNG